MFTGLVQAVGEVSSLDGNVLKVGSTEFWPGDPFLMGESVAVNGVCLTVVGTTEGLTFDLSDETLKVSTLGSLRMGSRVNLERALRPNDRLGGHFVQGHVDCVGTVVSVEENYRCWTVRFDAGAAGARYLSPKGSVCVNGVSLTVVSPSGGEFEVAVIPHTWSNTTLGLLKAGDAVNVEFDMLAKYLETLVANSELG